MTRAAISERTEQAHIVQLLRTLRASVYVLGTVRRHGDHPGTMQTPGLPDVLAFLPVRGESASARQPVHGSEWPLDAAGPDRCLQLCIEVKAARGRLSLPQRIFREYCERSGQAHIVGGLDAVIVWLIARGYLVPAQVPHYRRPAPG
jgi:hypothetical protein